MKSDSGHLARTLSAVEYFTFGFGTMVGVGWVVLIDDWLSRGGPGGAMLGFLAGGLLLLPVALTYGRLVRGLFQDVATFGLLAIFVLFTALGFLKGDAANWQPLFARPGAAGAWLSVFLVLQIVPYFMTGFESVGKGSEEARPGFDGRHFGRAILLAAGLGCLFYVTIIAVVSFV